MRGAASSSVRPDLMELHIRQAVLRLSRSSLPPRLWGVGAEDLSEQEALETLAAWSLFARWVDRAEVARGEPDHG